MGYVGIDERQTDRTAARKWEAWGSLGRTTVWQANVQGANVQARDRQAGGMHGGMQACRHAGMQAGRPGRQGGRQAGRGRADGE